MTNDAESLTVRYAVVSDHRRRPNSAKKMLCLVSAEFAARRDNELNFKNDPAAQQPGKFDGGLSERRYLYGGNVNRSEWPTAELLR